MKHVPLQVHSAKHIDLDQSWEGMHTVTAVWCLECPLDKDLSSLCTSLYCNWASEIKTKAVMDDLVGCLIIALQLVQHMKPVTSQACLNR